MGGLRQWLRPAAHAVRMARVRLGRIISPPRAWDGRHHPVLERVGKWSGESDGRYRHDFLGVKTDPRFREEFAADPVGTVAPGWPSPDATYFELVFVLEAVVGARERFTMMELGAGYGFWLVRAACAMRRVGERPARLIGVEMDPQHHRWMCDHFRDNRLDPDDHRLIHGAVSDRPGTVTFLREPEARLRYGQRIYAREAAPGTPAEVRVPCLTLNNLLQDESRVDLLHVDVQGEELRVLEPAAALLGDRVDRLLVATHSRRIHRRLRRLERGPWEKVLDFPFRSRCRTDYGDVYFVDGLLGFKKRRGGLSP